MQGLSVAAFWREEHAYFGRLLDLLERQLDVLAAGERPDHALMLDIIEYLREYSDRYHHRREDAAFELLARRLPRLRPQLERLQQQHRVIEEAGRALQRRLELAVEGGSPPRKEVEAAAAVYVLYYRHHIATEESEVVWRAVTALSPEDWQAVGDCVGVAFDPLFGATPRERYRELLARLRGPQETP